MRTYSSVIWGKLYTRRLVDKVDWRYCNYSAFDDEFWTPQVNLFTKGISFVQEQLYFYRRGVGGSMSVSTRPVRHLSRKIPQVDMPYELYQQNAKLLKKNGYDMEDYLLISYCTKLFHIVRNLMRRGLLTDTDKKHLSKQKKMMWRKVNNSTKVEFEDKYLLEILYNDLKYFDQVDRLSVTIKYFRGKIDELEKLGGVSALKMLVRAFARKIRKVTGNGC